MVWKPTVVVFTPAAESPGELSALRSHFEVLTARTALSAGLALLKAGARALIIDAGDEPGRAALQIHFFRNYMENREHSPVSVLMIVNSREDSVRELGLRCGADVVLARSFTGDELAKAVRETVQHASEQNGPLHFARPAARGVRQPHLDRDHLHSRR